MGPKAETGETRKITADTFRYVEQAFYVGVAIALAVAGAILFGRVVYQFVVSLGHGVLPAVLDFLDGLLLVFIFAELIHTVRAVVEENVLKMEPFLIVGVVAAIRRLIVISAEAEKELGKSTFSDLMLEMGLLVGAVLVLGFTVFLVRHTASGEPTPEHETLNQKGK